jgi:hypothetical protein
MQNENVKTSHRDVMPAMADFLWNTYPEEVQEMPATMQLMFEHQLETENMDDVSDRKACLRAIRALRELSATLKPFTHEDLTLAVTEFRELQKNCKNHV